MLPQTAAELNGMLTAATCTPYQYKSSRQILITQKSTYTYSAETSLAGLEETHSLHPAANSKSFLETFRGTRLTS